MRKNIPSALISVVAELVAHAETHASLENLLLYADASGEPPAGNKMAKVQAWLMETNKVHAKPLDVVARIVSGYIEDPDMDANFNPIVPQVNSEFFTKKRELVRKVELILTRSNLRYMQGGFIASGDLAPSKRLDELIRDRDVPSIHREFDRAMETVDSKPREAISAASNILESIFKIYIEDNELPMPDKQDLQPVFKVVRTHLGLDPSSVEDQDLQRIITGLFGVVDGIGALRTHAGSAHSEGRKTYRLEPRHARLAVSAAHTIASFILETWDKKKSWQ
ncbi:MAG: abortive infection family protein [Polynucleobacter sp.]